MTPTPTQALEPVEVTQADRERFFAKVDKRGPDECWPWIGSKNERGYGSMSHNGRLRKATHISYEIATGFRFPPGLMARHSCDNPPCVNPAHIHPGTNKQNVADMVSRKRHHANRRSHCIHGHPLSGDNLFLNKHGQRGCRTCNSSRRMALFAKNKRERQAQSGESK